jgi:hypothetical protein
MGRTKPAVAGLLHRGITRLRDLLDASGAGERACEPASYSVSRSETPTFRPADA